jgi:hypothetical protein
MTSDLWTRALIAALTLLGWLSESIGNAWRALLRPVGLIR